MVTIRALAFHAPRLRDGITANDLKELLKFREAFHEVSKSFATEIWTKRIVLPRVDTPGGRPVDELAEAAEKMVKEFGADFIALPFGKVKVELLCDQICEAMSSTLRTFFSFKAADLEDEFSADEALPLVNLVKQISLRAGIEACPRFAIIFGDQPETAYFPDTASQRMGFSISLRYVSDLSDAIKNRGIRNARVMTSEILSRLEHEAREASKASGLDYIGIDPSISPWMEESVAKLIADLIGDEFGNAGTHHMIYALNSDIIRASRSARTCGFREIMLPVAEDNELKRLASLGKLDLTLLTSLISVCVAGLDMVMLPLSAPDKKLAKLLLDVFAIAKARNKPAGVRLLFSESKPGEWVKMGRFGDVPVMRI